MARAKTKAKAKKETMEERAARLMKERLKTATTAAKTDNPGINPAMFGQAHAANIEFETEWKLERDTDEDEGRWVKSRRGRRTNNVFETLHKAGTLDQRQRVAGNYLVALYAESQGLQGSPDERGERVQCDAADPHETAMRSAIAGKHFADIMSRVEKTRYRTLLRALTRDIVLGDGAGNVQDGGVRWRRVIAVTLGLNSDRAQSIAVRSATDGLLDVIEAAEKRWAMDRKKPAMAA